METKTEIQNVTARLEKTPLEIAVRGLLAVNDTANVEVDYSYITFKAINPEGTVYAEAQIYVHYTTGKTSFKIDLIELSETLKLVKDEIVELTTENGDLYLYTNNFRSSLFMDKPQEIPQLEFNSNNYFVIEKGKTLYNILSNKMLKDDHEVTLSQENMRLTVKSGKIEVTLESYGYGNCKTTVNLKYLRKIFKVLRNMEDIFLKVTRDNILIVLYETPEIRLKYYIAPIIT